MERPSSVDETLLHSTLALTPDERLARFEAWYDDMRRRPRHGMIEAQRDRAA